jgi:hypothetical protein
MATKKIVQDIVPGEKHSIREVTLDDEIVTKPKINRPASKRKIVKKVVEEDVEIDEEESEDEDTIAESTRATSRKPKIKKKKISLKFLLTFVVIFVSVVVIGIALSLSYSKAVVTITPKVTNFDINGTFTAKKGNSEIDLNYDVISVTGSTSQMVVATKGPKIQTKAKGTVVIYNNHSDKAQSLVAGTRVATPDGLVYRTISSITVPGKKSVPGSVTTTVIADQPGANYNIKVADLKGDFKLPGYKGSDKYNGFYARMKTDMTGGFLGEKMVIDAQVKAKAVKALEDELRGTLLSKLQANLPDDYVLYDGAYSFEFETLDPIMKDAASAEIVVRSTVYGAIFKIDPLIKFIAGSEIKKFPSSTYQIDGEDDLAFKISNSKDFSAKKGTPLIFTLKGPITIKGLFSESKLKDDLKGIKLTDSNAVFAKYQSIANAHALITPFWLRSFPNSPERINIEYKH